MIRLEDGDLSSSSELRVWGESLSFPLGRRPLPSAPGRGRGGTYRRSLPSIYSGNGNSSSKEEDERLSNGLKEAVPSVILQRGKIHRLSLGYRFLSLFQKLVLSQMPLFGYP